MDEEQLVRAEGVAIVDVDVTNEADGGVEAVEASAPQSQPDVETPTTPFSASSRARTPTLPPHRFHPREQQQQQPGITIATTDAIAAAVLAQRRQGMGETVSNAMEVAQRLVQCDLGEQGEERLRARLQVLLYGPGGAPNITSDRKARSIADVLDDPRPYRGNAEGIRHPLEEYFGIPRQHDRQELRMPQPDLPVLAASLPQPTDPHRDRKGRSRGLTHYLPFRNQPKSPSPEGAQTHAGQHEFIAFGGAANDEDNDSEDTSRPPSELRHLGNRLKTYKSKRMRFPVVEKSKNLIHQLRQHDSSLPSSPKAKRSSGIKIYESPPAHRCRHTQKPKLPDDGSPLRGEFAQLTLPRSAPDYYLSANPFPSASPKDSDGQQFAIHKHTYYEASPSPNRSGAAAGLSMISRERVASLGAQAQAKAIANMVQYGYHHDGIAKGSLLQAAVTPRLEDYLDRASSRPPSRSASRGASQRSPSISHQSQQITIIAAAEGLTPEPYSSPAQRIRAQYANVLARATPAALQ